LNQEVQVWKGDLKIEPYDQMSFISMESVKGFLLSKS